jgi:hypothetical protein
MIAFIIMLATVPAADPIAVAATGLNAQIEDDIRPGGDIRLVSFKTNGCKTRMVGSTRKWTIDWRKTEMVAFEDTFIFVSAPPIKLAIVGDASIPDQAAKLAALNAAMRGAATRCRR